jgi:large subunit ribosomal protein L4
MHQALVRQLANARQGTADTKTRGEVDGGASKPWRQKGTGHARQGSTRAPHWKGGGVIFGPTPRSYEQRMPRKMRRLALKSALSTKVAAGQVKCLDALSFAVPRTRDMVAVLDRLAIDSTVLILLAKPDRNIQKSTDNLVGVKAMRAQYLNVADILGYDYLVIPLEAIAVIEETLGGAKEPALSAAKG